MDYTFYLFDRGGTNSHSTTNYEELVEENVFDVEYHARKCERRICLVVIFSVLIVAGFVGLAIYWGNHQAKSDDPHHNDGGTCPLNPQFPMLGGAGCANRCDDGRYSTSLNFEGEWPDQFMDRMYNISMEMEDYLIGIDKESSLLIMDYWDLSVHMTMDYFCCLSHPEIEIVDSIVSNYSWPEMEIEFESVICTDDGSHDLVRYPNGTFIEVVLYASKRSQKVVMDAVLELEEVIEEADIPIVVSRDENIGFHVTIGFVNGSSVEVPDLVDSLNRAMYWKDESILIESGPICSENLTPVDGVTYSCLTG